MSYKVNATFVVSLISLLLLSGCSKKSPLPDDMASMLQIYEQHFQQTRLKQSNIVEARKRISRPLDGYEAHLDGYTREAHNEIQSIFPQLPNPTLVMYIYPHLAGDSQSPVPGYSTSFSMYDRTHYALPGEAPRR